MALTSVTGSPTMVELPKLVEVPVAAPKSAGSDAGSDTSSDTGSISDVAPSVASDETSAPATSEKAVETVPDVVIEREELPIETSPVTREASPVVREASPVLREASPVLREASPVVREASPMLEEPARTDSMIVQASLSPREQEFPDTNESPKRSLSERRGRPLKRVDASPTPSVPRGARSATDERKRAAVARAAAAAVEENGLAAQRKRGLPNPVVRRKAPRTPLTLPKNYYSDTETLRTTLRGGALTRSRPRSRLPRMTNPAETEYTLYLAGPNHDDRNGLGEKLFVGKLSDQQNGGELKQRVGCRLRTQLRPAEKEISGMKVKEVAKSLEEMVLDIFFHDAVLRLEVMWDEDI